MPTIKQHVPGFVNDGEGGATADFETAEELLAIPFVARWAADDYTGQGAFHRFSLSPESHPGLPFSRALLMAEYAGGRRWYVVGYITGDHAGLDLPAWRMPKE